MPTVWTSGNAAHLKYMPAVASARLVYVSPDAKTRHKKVYKVLEDAAALPQARWKLLTKVEKS